jgi:hypothetical protein
MAFVNEYVPEEDIKKYNLMEIWDSFRVPSHRGELLPGFRFTWTIDRERNIFFMPVRGGTEEHPTRDECVLWWNGSQVVITIDRCLDNLHEVNKKTVWELINICKPTNFTVSDNEIINILKEALTTYGVRGIWHSTPNYIVEFKF